MTTTGKITGVNGNMITVSFEGAVAQNEVGYAMLGEQRLMAEIVRVRGKFCDMQVFESTTDLTVGTPVEFTGELLAAELGPGMLAQVYDGLQNPLAELAKAAGQISSDAGYFLQRGMYLPGLPRERKWDFHPTAKAGDRVSAGDVLGWVTEGIFDNKTMPGHKIMVPFALRGVHTIASIAPAGDYTVTDTIAELTPASQSSGAASTQTVKVQMMQRWPVKVPIRCFAERLEPTETLETTVRTIDTFFPVAVGGTYCIPGPFGAGKTVLQQTTARYAKVDIVISAACGERAGEVVETLKEFPEIVDPKTGQSLMQRTIIICNTSSMPVASREASVYTAVTLAEYFRQQGLNVLVLADSTSRWAQAMRELSGRLEEIPGEEAFPAYLESRIAAFYERAGRVRLRNGETGSVTIGGTVSPAGGNFDEPVTQATLKVVGGFHGLSRARSDARRYPAIDPLESWSHYNSVIEQDRVERARSILRKGNEVGQMMKVVGEEGTSLDDFTTYLKAEFLDAVYLQQNAFSDTDATTPATRQRVMFDVVEKALLGEYGFKEKAETRKFFMDLQQTFIDWNDKPSDTPDFAALKEELEKKITSACRSS
ncbi:MAG: V-type ATP synthase subunit A [Kiritimatiellae bacterium]|nr:V-type ATP synthase subunit A [Kiritimatiellia bacterium]